MVEDALSGIERVLFRYDTVEVKKSRRLLVEVKKSANSLLTWFKKARY